MSLEIRITKPCAAMRRTTLLLMTVLSTAAVSAQRVAEVRSSYLSAQSVADARALFVVGDVKGATEILLETNTYKDNSAFAYLEAARKLARLSASFANLQEIDHAQRATALAVSYFEAAEAALVKTGQRKLAAQALEGAAQIQSQVLGEPVTADTFYERALVHDPQSPGANAAMQKRQKIEEQIEKKQLRKGGS